MRKPKEIFLPKNKHVLLYFTGGLDSTYLLWKNLELGNTVSPVYVEIKNNDNKSKIEIQQAKFIWSLLKESYEDKLKPIMFGSNLMINNTFGSPLRLKQVPMWIFFALYHQDINEHDEIQIGYVQDDAVSGSYLKDMEKMYYSFLPITDGLIDINFPLRKYSKNEIIHELPDNIFDAIVTCEAPKIKPYKISNAFTYDQKKEDYRFWKPCGNCVMCKNIKNNDYYYTNKPYSTELDEEKRKSNEEKSIWREAEPRVEDEGIVFKKQ